MQMNRMKMNTIANVHIAHVGHISLFVSMSLIIWAQCDYDAKVVICE